MSWLAPRTKGVTTISPREVVLDFWKGYASEVKPFTYRRNYRQYDGRPVLFFGYVHAWKFYERFGVTPAEIVQIVRSVIHDAYLVATSTEREYWPLLKSWGFDACTCYLLHGKGWANTMESYRWEWDQLIELAKQTGIKVWIPATSGYDGSAWATPESLAGFSHVPTPEQFTAHLIEAKEFARRHFVYTDGEVIAYSWNEFGEQVTPIEPTVRNGDAYLRAFKEAVAA